MQPIDILYITISIVLFLGLIYFSIVSYLVIIVLKILIRIFSKLEYSAESLNGLKESIKNSLAKFIKIFLLKNYDGGDN